MEFKYSEINEIFRRSQEACYIKDPYTRLAAFEHDLSESIACNRLSGAVLLEAHRIIVMINKAEIKIIERRDGIDIDGDGIIG